MVNINNTHNEHDVNVNDATKGDALINLTF